MILSIHKKWRSNFLLFMILLGFCALCYRLVGLTIVQHKFLKHQGEIRSSRVIPLAATRGLIADRNGTPLAVSLPVTSLWVNPKQIHWPKHQVTELSRILSINKSKLLKKVNNQHKGFVYLKRKLTPQELKAVDGLKLSGIHRSEEYRRYYPMAEEVAQLIGITNTKEKGQEGLELAFDSWLKGKSGREEVEKDRMGHIISVKNITQNPIVGKTLKLSIDARIQSMAYESLQNGVKKYGAESGSAIVMNPETGEVLAMANFPSFNPNNLLVADFSKIKNRCTTDLFEPGSTIKTFSMISILSSGKYGMNSKVDTGKYGQIKIHGNFVKDEFWHHGKLSLTDVIKKSSNVGISKLTLSLPNDRLPHLLEKLGFTRFISGFPGEVAGRISERYAVDPFELATLSFGYGITVTHLQLAHAYSILANNGVDVGVHFTSMKDKPIGHRIFSKQVAHDVMQMLESVVQKGGTGTRARIPGIKVAGKTGTARVAGKSGYGEESYIASFVGLIPAKHPQYVISVVLNKPSHKFYFGGLSAAPIFSKLGSKVARLGLTDGKELVS